MLMQEYMPYETDKRACWDGFQMNDKVYLNKPTLVMIQQPKCKVQVFLCNWL